MNLNIRAATDADEDVVVALWRSCGLVVSSNDPVADFRFARAKANSDILVGVNDDGRVVGSALVGYDGHRGWLYYVAADPGLRKQGIGRSMVRAGEAWLVERGVPKLLLMVGQSNNQVIDFYERIGFQLNPMTVMQKWLKPPR